MARRANDDSGAILPGQGAVQSRQDKKLSVHLAKTPEKEYVSASSFMATLLIVR